MIARQCALGVSELREQAGPRSAPRSVLPGRASCCRPGRPRRVVSLLTFYEAALQRALLFRKAERSDTALEGRDLAMQRLGV